jgi:hypothetical protein
MYDLILNSEVLSPFEQLRFLFTTTSPRLSDTPLISYMQPFIVLSVSFALRKNFISRITSYAFTRICSPQPCDHLAIELPLTPSLPKFFLNLLFFTLLSGGFTINPAQRCSVVFSTYHQFNIP